jgi:hypothetical protein
MCGGQSDLRRCVARLSGTNSPLPLQDHQELIPFRSMNQVSRPLSSAAVGNPLQRVPFDRIKPHISRAANWVLDAARVDRLLVRIDLVGAFAEALPSPGISPRNFRGRNRQFNAARRIPRHSSQPHTQKIISIVRKQRRISKRDASSPKCDRGSIQWIHTMVNRPVSRIRRVKMPRSPRSEGPFSTQIRSRPERSSEERLVRVRP